MSNPTENSLHSVVQEMNSQTVLKTLEIRLQGIREIAKRVRFSFIVLIIASCAIFIAIYNGHFSWNRKAAFPFDMRNCLDKVSTYNTEELEGCLVCQKNNQSLEEQKKCEVWKNKETNNQQTLEQKKMTKLIQS